MSKGLMGNSYGVAKILVSVTLGSVPTLLMSRKRAPSRETHGRLELLGGNMEGPDPLLELIRELEEEESSGHLARLVADLAPVPAVFDVEDTRHHIFTLPLAYEDYLELRHGPDESLGLKLVPVDRVRDPAFASRFTRRTRGILDGLGL